MSTIWMAISPGPRETRVIAMAGARETILKARLAREPAHPRAMATLLEAVALWQGATVRAALCAAERDGASDSSLYRAAFADVGGPLYTLDWVPAPERARRRHRDIKGVDGDFADLRDLLVFEVAR
jgi:hypothetical protein